MFFTNLNKADSNLNEFHKDILKKFHAMKNKLHHSNFLEPEITINEIKTALKSLKNGKSSSTDMIANEMLKHGGYLMLNSLGKLFNFILNSGTFPQSWNESYLVLLYKSGNRLDPSNYRGISITSNLGKLFNRIIHTRLLEFVKSMSLISENQIGFKENCRTSDHLFSIKTIIDHYKSKKVYAAFIDLRKAFDTVWRESLFYKLLNSNISQKLFNILFFHVQQHNQ